MSPSLLAGVAEEEVGIASEVLYRVALQHVYENDARLQLSDESAGIMKFRWTERGFDDDGAVIEVIKLGAAQSKVRVTFPKDFGGRAQRALGKLVGRAKDIDAGKWGKLVPGKAQMTYQASMRFVLKKFVNAGFLPEDVLSVAEEEFGIIQFVFREGRFSDPKARIQIVPVNERESRIQVSLPADPGRRILLEKELITAIKKDSGNEIKDRL